MTVNEAIERIKEHARVHLRKEAHAVHITEALQMACNALEKQKKLTDENIILKQKRANIFEIVDAFSRGRKDGVKNFAKFLIDKAENGVICVSDLPDLVLEMEIENEKKT